MAWRVFWVLCTLDSSLIISSMPGPCQFPRLIRYTSLSDSLNGRGFFFISVGHGKGMKGASFERGIIDVYVRVRREVVTPSFLHDWTD